jgi:hypothetical protein
LGVIFERRVGFLSLPKIPEISISRCQAINLLLASIAEEELALSNIINAEGEKIKKSLEVSTKIQDLLQVNRSVEKMMRNVIKQEIMLQFKLEDVIDLIMYEECTCLKNKKKS